MACREYVAKYKAAKETGGLDYGKPVSMRVQMQQMQIGMSTLHQVLDGSLGLGSLGWAPESSARFTSAISPAPQQHQQRSVQGQQQEPLQQRQQAQSPVQAGQQQSQSQHSPGRADTPAAAEAAEATAAAGKGGSSSSSHRAAEATDVAATGGARGSPGMTGGAAAGAAATGTAAFQEAANVAPAAGGFLFTPGGNQYRPEDMPEGWTPQVCC